MISDKKYPYFYWGKVNRVTNPYLMKDEELYDLVNFYTTELGSKKVRPGLTPYLNQADTSKVVHLSYSKLADAGKKLLRFSGNKVYAVDPTSASSWGSSIYTNSVNWDRPESVAFASKVHIVDQHTSSGQYLEYNGSSITERTTTSGTDTVVPYKGKTIVVYHGRVYVANSYYSQFYRSYVSFSSVDYVDKGTSPSSPWTTLSDDPASANYFPVDIDYKGSILKLTNINDRLNIYKEEGVYRFNEESLFAVFGVAPIDNTISTMEETREDYFLTSEGFYKSDGNTVSPVGEGWYLIIKEILKNGIDTSKVFSGSANYNYYCYLGNVTYDGQTLANACFVYNARYDEMWLWSFGQELSCFGYYIDNNGRKVTLFGSASGKVYKLDEDATTDDGTPIFAYFRSKYYYFDDLTLWNYLSEIYPYTRQNTSGVKILVDRDFQNDYQELNVDFDRKDSSKIDYDSIGRFKSLSIKVAYDGKGKQPVIDGFVFDVKEFGEPKVTEGKS